MRTIILYASPKQEGLAASCLAAAKKGLEQTGSEVDVAALHQMKLGRCLMCRDGWGSCRNEYKCVIDDDLASLQERIAQADAVIIETPVYFSEVTEVLKTCMDRIRRCEALNPEGGAFAGKPALLIASPGGSGNGALSCLTQLERFCNHVKMPIFDYFDVNRWNREYKLAAIKEAAKLLGSGKKPG